MTAAHTVLNGLDGGVSAPIEIGFHAVARHAFVQSWPHRLDKQTSHNDKTLRVV